MWSWTQRISLHIGPGCRSTARRGLLLGVLGLCAPRFGAGLCGLRLGVLGLIAPRLRLGGRGDSVSSSSARPSLPRCWSPPSPLLLQGQEGLVGLAVESLPPRPVVLLLPAVLHCIAVRRWVVASFCSCLSVSLGPPPASSRTWLVDHGHGCSCLSVSLGPPPASSRTWLVAHGHGWYLSPPACGGLWLFFVLPSLLEEFGDLVREAHDEDPGFISYFWQVPVCDADQFVGGLSQLMPGAQSPPVGLV